MPSLGSHMVRARAVADRLSLPEIDADRGSFYFGATAPDVRVITRKDRRVTHFYELDVHGRQDSVARMFEENPGLARPAGLDAATTSFMAGYITHLVLDERYIEGIYRPQFGAYSDLGDDPRRNVLDRALQYELDRRDREDREAMDHVRTAIAGSLPVQGIPFIEDEHLVQWHQVAIDVAGQPPDYTRFRRMMSRHLVSAGLSDEEIDELCDAPQAIVGEAYEQVSTERLERFWEEAYELMHDRLRWYLR